MDKIINPLDGEMDLLGDTKSDIVRKLNPLNGRLEVVYKADSYIQKINPFIGDFDIVGGTGASYIIKEVTGSGYINLTNAIANHLMELKAYGGTEQDGTPTPDTPVDIVCNNGVLTFGTGETYNTADGQGTFVSPSALTTNRIYKAFGKLKAGKYKVKITGDFEFIFQYKDAPDQAYTQYGNIGTWTTEGEYEITDTSMYYGVAIRNTGNIGNIYPSNFNNIGTIGYAYLDITPVGTVETISSTLSTATAEMLLKVGDYADEQEILSGDITRKVGIKVLDGTESWVSATRGYTLSIPGKWQDRGAVLICTHFKYSTSTLPNIPDNSIMSFGTTSIGVSMDTMTSLNDFKQFLADQYNAGTPVIVVYPLATPTTETVAGQTMNIQAGSNTIEITQASIDNLGLYAKYKATA